MQFNNAEEIINENMGNVKEDDLSELIDKEKRLFSMLIGTLSEVSDDVKTMFSLAKDYYNGIYQKISWERLSIIIFALLYLLMPFDIIPDIIPIIGYVDDLAVISACLKIVSDELKDYKNWKSENQKAS